ASVLGPKLPSTEITSPELAGHPATRICSWVTSLPLMPARRVRPHVKQASADAGPVVTTPTATDAATITNTAASVRTRFLTMNLPNPTVSVSSGNWHEGAMVGRPAYRKLARLLT